MENNQLPPWLAHVFTLLSGGGLTILAKLGYDLYTGKRKANQDDVKVGSETKISENKAAHEIRLSEQDLNFKALRGLLEDTQTEVEVLKDDMKKVQSEHLQAREQLAEAKMELRYVKEENLALKVQVNELKGEILKLKSK